MPGSKRKKSNKSKSQQKFEKEILSIPRINPVFLSVSEAAKISGVNDKTIRRAIQNKKINYKIVKNRYQIEFASLIKYSHTTLKLKNKLNNFGLGQYIEKWRK